jgi:hypothetical protein
MKLPNKARMQKHKKPTAPKKAQKSRVSLSLLKKAISPKTKEQVSTT